MTLSDRAVRRVPPVWLARSVEAVRNGLRKATLKSVPPPVGILDATMGSVAGAQTIYAAAQLGIADALADGPLTAEAIAARIGTHPGATERLLRALTMQSVFTRRRDGTYQLTATAQALRSDSAMSVRPLLLILSHPLYWEHWGRLAESVRTGDSSLQAAYGMPLFECLEHEPDVAQVFNDAMTCTSALVTPPLLAAYDFTDAGTVVDIGGGNGRLLSAILRAAPLTRGVLFDLAGTETEGRAHLRAEGLGDRSEVRTGSFFDTVPHGGDVYVLKHILHDWDDADAGRILGRVRAAMAPGARLLVIEAVLPAGNRPHLGKFLDLDMLIFAGGRERTATEYEKLLGTHGFRLNRLIPTASHVSIIEAVGC